MTNEQKDIRGRIYCWITNTGMAKSWAAGWLVKCVARELQVDESVVGKELWKMQQEGIIDQDKDLFYDPNKQELRIRTRNNYGTEDGTMQVLDEGGWEKVSGEVFLCALSDSIVCRRREGKEWIYPMYVPVFEDGIETDEEEFIYF